jgi:hypothetical protein
VGNFKIPNYQVRRNGRGFWEPTRRMRELGFRNIACSPDGPDAWTLARQWQARWEAASKGHTSSPAMVSAENLSPDQVEELTIYPRGSLGEGFRRFRKTDEWKNKKPRTREDWWRVYRRIKPVFGDCDPKTVTLEDLDAWRAMIEQTVSLREAHRCIKIWRALWRKLAALGYCVRDSDPSLAITNKAAKGRSAMWTEGEVVRLFKRAWREGYHGLAAVIAVLWSTQQSPGDVRMLVASQLVTDGAGAVFFTERAKTDKPVGGALSDRALAAVEAYVKVLGVELHGDAPIFRNRSGAPYSSDTLGDDFRDIRHMELGSEESRTLADFRRSGTQEAFAGDALPADVSHAMGNTIATSNMLFATYHPVNLTSLWKVHEARIKGRRMLRERGRTMRPALARTAPGGTE